MSSEDGNSPAFLTVDEVLLIQQNQITLYGGAAGLRDRGMLEAAVAQPQATYGGEYLHPSLASMAAAYLFHLVENHPFVDGNKRAGLAASIVFLNLNDIDLPEELDGPESPRSTLTCLEAIVLKVASGLMSKPELTRYFESWCKS